MPEAGANTTHNIPTYTTKYFEMHFSNTGLSLSSRLDRNVKAQWHMVEQESLKRATATETGGIPRPKPVAPISHGHHHAVSNQDGYFFPVILLGHSPLLPH